MILVMLMMRGTGWTEETLMAAVSLSSLQKGYSPVCFLGLGFRIFSFLSFD